MSPLRGLNCITIRARIMAPLRGLKSNHLVLPLRSFKGKFIQIGYHIRITIKKLQIESGMTFHLTLKG